MRVPARAVIDEQDHFFLSSDRGFLPRVDPLLSLPPSFSLWDEAAGQLPELYRDLAVRRVLDELPYLDTECLLEDQLWRAATVLGILAHAYWRAEPTPPSQLPSGLLRSWEGVCARLGRSHVFLAYAELILGNWRRRDPSNPSMELDNLDLLVPTIGNQAERVFYLTQVEIAARSAPLVPGIVRLQEACVDGCWAEVETELETILAVLRHLTERTLAKIDLNEHSSTFVDPVLWAKTVGPFAVPLRPGEPGPGGTAAPTFHLLDALFSRQTYQSVLGQESRRLNEVAPEAWRRLVAAVGEFSLSSHIDPRLRSLLDQAYQAYAGPHGLLSAHRLKARGYLELAFKLGRSVTLGGFKGLFRDRTWDEIDEELERSRAERLTDAHLQCHFAKANGGQVIEHSQTEWTCYLDLEAPELRWRPGDLLYILPENSDALVARTLEALNAPPGTSVPLDPVWSASLKLRDGFQDDQLVSLENFLRFARIRPLEQQTAWMLYRLSRAPFLKAIVESSSEGSWELWEVLDKLRSTGFDTRRLWQAEVWEPESLCRVVSPERFRPYSVWSAREGHVSVRATGLAYKSANLGSEGEVRFGTSSHFLRRLAQGGSQRRISFRLLPGHRFSLPQDPTRPIVMFAGGAGVSPFLGFISERSESDSWLLASFRGPQELGQADRLARWWSQGRLRLDIAFSRSDVGVRLNPSVPSLEFPPGQKSRMPELIARLADELRLWLLPIEQGGRGASVYVCGRPQFAGMVWSQLSRLIGSELLGRMVAEGRLQQDVFTAHSELESRRQFDFSEIVRHDGSLGSTWVVIEGKVYDLTEFRQTHPGGEKLLASYAGCDATQAYRGVGHHLSPKIYSWLGLYEIGVLRQLKLGRDWGVALGQRGLESVTLVELYRRWVAALSLVAEIDNAVRLDLAPLPDRPCLLDLLQLVEAHRRFQANLETLFEDEFLALWGATSGLCDPEARWHSFSETTSALGTHPGRLWADSMSSRLGSVESGLTSAIDDYAREAESVRRADVSYIASLKVALTDGVTLFEVYEAEVLRKSSARLLEVAATLPATLERYLHELADLGC